MKKAVVLVFLGMIAGLSSWAQNRSDTVILVSNTKVEIHYTDMPVMGVILVLPGWNFPQDDICNKSDFCTRAKQAGYILVMPDMKKSIYHQQFYPETRADWRQYHSLAWITDTLIPLVRLDFGLLQPGKRNFIFGISTGGRGVAMVALYTKGLFVAGAALSGDYNQLLMPEDNLMKGYYGTSAAFPLRWSGADNPSKNISKLKIPLFLAHGRQDKIVPCQQTELFYEQLHLANKALGHRLVMKEGEGHDYSFWSSQYPAVFDFFKMQH